MPIPIIEVNRLSKRYQLGHFGMSSFREESEKWIRRLRGQTTLALENKRDFWALRDVSFSVNAGEVIGIIGRNGAGKSTLLKLLSRITEPTAGEIVLRGRVASLLEVGTGFHPELSGRENVFLNGAILGMKRAEIARKFDEIVAFAEIQKFIDTPVKRYSSGMYVKLAFAVAAHLEPDILIVDEVLAVGDAAFQKKCVAKVGEVSSHGRTVLFVSHNIGLISALCRSAIVLEQGVLTHHGDVKNAIARYNQSVPVRSTRPVSKGVDNDRPALMEVTLSPSDQGPIVTAATGYRLTITSTKPAPGLGVVVNVRNSAGTVIHHFNTDFDSPENLARDAISGRFILDVPQACLPPGTYTLDIELWTSLGRQDILENACELEISDGYFEGRKTDSFVNRCTSIISHAWTRL